MIPKDVVEWMIGDDSGSSSRAIVTNFYGIKSRDNGWYPLDSDDFGRCIRMLEKFPHITVYHMESVNSVWAAYVERWDEMTVAYHRVILENRQVKVSDEEVIAVRPKAKRWSPTWYKIENQIRDQKRRAVYKFYFGDLIGSIRDSAKEAEDKFLKENNAVILSGVL